MKGEKVKMDLQDLHTYLHKLSWQILSKAVEHKDKGLIAIHADVEKLIDLVIYGPRCENR